MRGTTTEATTKATAKAAARVAGLFIATIGLSTALGACSSAAATHPGAAPSADANAIQLSAKDLKFSAAAISAPANRPFEIAFNNQDGAPHNVAIYDSSFSTKAFGEDPVSGPKQVVYNVKALPAGTYGFRCDVHPDMEGTLDVQ
jgi:plastocyanin